MEFNKDTNNVINNNENNIAGDNFTMINGDNISNVNESGYEFNGAKRENEKKNININDGFNFSPYYTEPGRTKEKKKTSGGFKRAMSYVLVGIVCAAIGGGAALGSALYLLPNTDFFENTPLYENMSKNNSAAVTTQKIVSDYDIHPTTVAGQEGGMTIVDIVQKVSPAVVGVSTKSVNPYSFLQNVQEGIGSGMILNEDGYVLTNYHVVAGASEVKVILSTGKEVAAKVVNFDANHDVAVVKITEDIKMPGIVELGNSNSLKVGESVVAIGNPLGKEFLGSVTNGIVSAVNRSLGEDDISYIQTNAAINSGNSGGPLLNAQGQVIGINTAKINATGVEGLGFAIPIDLIKDKIPNLSKAPLMIGITGLGYDKTTEADFKRLGYPEGVYVREIQTFSPAEKGGIKIGDVIVKFDGKKVKSVADINELKTKHKAGDVVKVEVYRDGKTKNLEIKLEEQ